MSYIFKYVNFSLLKNIFNTSHININIVYMSYLMGTRKLPQDNTNFSNTIKDIISDLSWYNLRKYLKLYAFINLKKITSTKYRFFIRVKEKYL